MQQLILLVRKLRQIAAFKVSTRAVVITLMVLGIWVATKKLDFPPDVNVNDKLIHAVVFFGFAVLVDLASSRKPFWLWKGLPLLAYGIGIEVMQYFTPFRSFSVADMVADFAGILIYFLLKSSVLYIVKRNSKDSKFT
ncbi:MAG: VanZ family protein [Cocleimonas sp.]